MTTPWRLHAAALAVLFAFVVALFPFAFLRNEAFIGDSDRLMHELPTYRALADALARGEEPGWNPHIFCGTRAIGDPLMPSANLPMRALTAIFPDRLAVATTWRFVAEMVFALFCAYFLFLPGMPPFGAAVVPALAIACSTAALENLNRGAAYSAFAWAPAALLVLRDAAERPFLKTAVLLVPSLYMQATASEIQHASYFGLFYVLFLAARGIRDRDGIRRPARTVGALAAAAGLAAALAAPQIVPFLDAAGSSDRVRWSLSEAWRNGTHSPLAALRLFLPHVYGDGTSFPVGRLGPHSNELEMFPAYPGIAALFLSGCALAHRKDRTVRIWIWGAIFLVLASLRTPAMAIPHLAFLGKPLLHGRLSHLIPVAFAFLAPAGLSALLAMDRARQERIGAGLVALGATAFLLAGPFLSTWTGPLPERFLGCFGQVRDAHDAYCHGLPQGTRMPGFPELARSALLLFAAGAAALGVATRLLASGRIPTSGFGAILAAVALVDSFWVGRATLQPFPMPEDRVAASNDLSRFLAGLPDIDRHRVSFSGFVPWPGAAATAGLYRHNLHALHGLSADGGYANFLDARAQAVHALERPFFRWKSHAIGDPYLADLYAVKYVVVPDTPAARASYAGFCDPVFSADGAAVLAKRDPVPRWRILGRWTIARPDEVLAGFRMRALPLDVVRLEAPPPDDWRDVAPDAFGTVEIVEESANRVSGRARLSAPGVLLIADIWDPGWRAEVDGRDVPIARAHHAFRAVRLPSGESRFVFTYGYPGLSCLRGIATAAGAVWLAAGLWAFRPRRRGT